MLNKRLYLIVFFALFSSLFSSSGEAQDNLPSPVFAVVIGGEIYIYGLSDTPVQVENLPHQGISDLLWSPDHTTLAYILRDIAYQPQLEVVTVRTN
ncbi:MAG TPA: hypothetical protein VHL11_12920, partial [Phototrophicaceae bacterium]|nr:hypothetical protein [Phototrophicaceae bacterium]